MIYLRRLRLFDPWIWAPLTILLFFQFFLLSQQPELRSEIHWLSLLSRESPSTKSRQVSGSVHEESTPTIEPSTFEPTVTEVERIHVKKNTTKSKPRMYRGKMKSKANLSCSSGFTLPVGVRPVPFNVSSFHGNSTHLTCSMGCANATIPVSIPSFIIIGAQKGGTSALYHYFEHMPMVLQSSTFEAHFWDIGVPRNISSPENFSQERLCDMRYQYIDQNFDLSKYDSKVQQLHPEPVFTFEKTPAYIRSPGVAYKIHLAYPNIKLIAILRNPVSRIYSSYQMAYYRATNGSIAESFEHWLQKTVESLRAAQLSVAPTLDEYLKNPRMGSWDFSLPPGLSFQETMRLAESTDTWTAYNYSLSMTYNGLYTGMYAVHLSQWLKYFELNKTLMVVQFEKLMVNKAAVFQDICHFLGIPYSDLEETVLEKDYRPFHRNTTKKSREKAPVDPLLNETRHYLENFYRPYNQELARMLGGQWQNAWYE